MRRWSEELVDDREFEIGGELFEWVYPHWEAGAKLFNEELTPVLNGDGSEPTQFDWVENTKKAVDGVPMFLNPKNDAVKRWKALCARKTDPVPRHQISQLYNWLVQITGNLLPTSPPSSPQSDDGDGGTGAASSDAQPSTEATSKA